MALGLGIFAFVLVCVIGVQFMLNRELLPLHSDLHLQEGFSSSASRASGTTRAADCNCLPGYIASNSGGYDGKIYWAFYGAPVYVPNGTKDVYYIDPNNTCNLVPTVGNQDQESAKFYQALLPRLPNSSNPNDITFANPYENYAFKGVLTCDVVKKTDSKNYFCQNLGDPTKTRSCY